MEWLPEVLELTVRALQVGAVGLLAYGAYVVLVGGEPAPQRDPLKTGQRAAWRRAIVMTVAAAALLLAGVLLGEMMSSRAGRPEAAPRMGPTSEPALETFYVPRQHINAAPPGSPIEEPVQEFY